ncbi:MAG TPA: metallophosphoesterase [Methylobacter sp.]
MSSKIRWLHLSDFHVGMDNYGQRKLLREICDHIKQMVCNEFVPDFVFITGDIANFGLASEYQEFFEYFLAPMSESLGKLWDGKIISVPGNHDVNRHRSPHFSPDQILASVGNLFDPTEAGKLSRAQFADRFQDYIQNDTSGVPNNWLNTKDGSFAIKAAVRSSNVGIVGVNTAWLSKDDKDRHKLTPGKHLLDDALNQLQDCKLKIVLGHHPIDWLDDGQAQMIRVLLGKHSCLYLHGHLHENDARYDDGGRGEFLAIRCGSAFQGRADDKPRWINGLMWAEANIDERKIEIRPFHWSVQHEEWKLTTDAFPNKYETMGKWTFPLPGSNTHHGHQIPPKALSKSTARSQNEYLPPGWVLVDRQFIEERMGEVIDERLLQFFDGSPPTWRIALSSFVPQRELVENLRSRFNHLDDAVKPSVINLLGPSGEGKSTVFFQTIAKLVVEDGWVALWRYNDLAQIDVMAIQKLFSKYQKLLVAIDDAHSLASRFATGLSRLGRAPIAHFLLCSRTLDWRAEVREMGSITVASDYQELTCHGISPLDASLIVNAWAHLGKKGLGALAHIPLSDAADALLKASRDTENDLEEGAFFGAMLQLRYGDKLKDRIRTVLYRLNAIQESGPPVLDAYAIIAAMHAEGLRFLSTPVLAEYLGLPASDLQKMVMRPLADEALAAGGGRFLLCRHKSIAKASISVLRETNLFLLTPENQPA